MEMEKVYLDLDGIKNGIGVYIYGAKDFIRNKKDNSIKLFSNMALAKSYLVNTKNIKHPNQYRLYLILGKSEIDFEYVEFVNGYYEFYSESSKKYLCKETVTNRVTSFGYIVFENGDTKKLDKNTGYKKEKEMFQNIKDCARYILTCKYDPTFSSIIKEENGNIVCSVKDSTAKIHFCTNNNMLDFNQLRKESNEKCLPFIKTMDRYTTFYCYATIMDGEPKWHETPEKINNIIECMISYFNDYFPELETKYIPVEYKGTVVL